MFETYPINPLDGLIPAGVSLVVMAAAWKRPRVGAPIALALGFAPAFRLINGAWPGQFPPTDTKLWIFWIALATGVIGLLDAIIKPPNWARLIEPALVGAIATALMLMPRLRDTGTRTGAIGWIVGAGLVSAIWWLAFERTADRPQLDRTRVIAPLAMFLLALCCGILLMMSGTLIYGRFGIAFAGAAAPIVVAAMINPRFDDRGTTAITIAPALGALVVAGCVYGDLTLVSVVLIAGSPLFLLPGQFPAIQRLRPLPQAIISLLLLILPLAVAIAIATPEFRRTMSEQSSSYGE